MQDLFLQIFKKNIDDAGSRELLMEATTKYPYFTAGHFFLLKTTANAQPGYNRIAAKTALHFNNPLLLNYRLNEVEQVEEKEKVTVQNVEKMEEPVFAEQEIIPEPTVIEPEPVDTAKKNDDMIFEPLFASDYFASQGIKLTDEVHTGDKLGKQLKSFTEWLKGMKKLHETKAAEETVQIDLAVQKLAEKSNQEDDILTESMAEAYLQQGKTKKAIETLEKLSLLNPAKSAYFAAKIVTIGLNK